MVGSILVVGALIHCALLYPMVGSILVVGALLYTWLVYLSSGCTHTLCIATNHGLVAMHNVVGALTTLCIATNPWLVVS